ncbi:MAG TPA: site-2 protease family protein [Candidatus Paceibacterota bacterium]
MVIFLSFIILIFSIIVHEIAHGFAADTLGDPTARLSGRLTLNPIPHIDLMGSIVVPAILLLSGSTVMFGWAKPVPYNPYNLKNRRWGEAFVAAAGAAVNIFIAILFGLMIRFGGAALPAPAVELASTITFVNLFLGLFNLIPFPPLDGFTVLRSILPWHLGYSLTRLEARLHATGPIFLILFLFIFSSLVAGPFFYLVASLFGLITGGPIY